MSKIEVDKVDPQSGTALEIGTSGDTVTVPTGAGLTVVDEVKTNKISPATGTAFALGDSGDTFTVPSGATITNNGTATGFGGGKIGQVISSSKIDTQSMTLSAFTDITDLSVTITPSATDSKIFWTFTFSGGDNTNYGIAKIVYGDGSDLTTAAIHESAGNRIRGTTGWAYVTNAYETVTLSGQGLDSPATTSATTYKIQMATSGTFYVNRTVTWADDATTYAGIGTLTVMEVLA